VQQSLAAVCTRTEAATPTAVRRVAGTSIPTEEGAVVAAVQRLAELGNAPFGCPQRRLRDNHRKEDKKDNTGKNQLPGSHN
jgi:hypothetical protein